MPHKKQDKTKIIQIWGEILDEGFTSVPNILLRYRSRIGLKPKHIMLIIDIMSYKWDAEYPFPSNSTLALRAGIEERSVKRITQDLEELGLLIKTPRFDGETGAQVTTIFDFRPLVQKLIEEMNKGDDLLMMDEENEVGVGRATNDNVSVQRKTEREIQRKGDDKIVMGEGDQNVTRGVTKLSRGGVTKMSPKEDTYYNKNNSVLTHEENLTYGSSEKHDKNADVNESKRVSKYFRESIFRKRIFEIYDNLIELKPIEELVEEGAHRACKDVIVNRVLDIEKMSELIDPAKISKEVRRTFPYKKLPSDPASVRNFYTAAICDMVSGLISHTVLKNKKP